MTHDSRPPCLTLRRLLCTFSLTGLMAVIATTTHAATLVVTNTATSGPGSLQQAILDANATNGLDTIIFQIPGSGVHTISPTAALPHITDPVVIDGTTQTGYAGKPLIEISGASAGASDGLLVTAGNTTIRGLAINRFARAGIHLQAPGGSNVVQGNFIGTDPTGTLDRGNGQGTAWSGVWLDASSGNFVGGLDATNRNVISGNEGSGVYVLNCRSNVIQGNLIGTSVSGTTALGNSTNGISLYNAAYNQIGGAAPAARNIISGNGWNGIGLTGAGTTGNLVQGNYIGTSINGNLALANAAAGVALNSAPGNTIGGTDAGAGNLLSGNSQVGLNLTGPGADNNLVQGNLIGTDVSGRSALGNAYSGITILNGNSNLIGGTVATALNVISANKQAGVYISTNSTGNIVQGNYIGVDATGTNALGNVINGVSIDSAASNMVGGAATGAGNIISANTNYGIEIYNAPATANTVQGNYIGTDIARPRSAGQQVLGHLHQVTSETPSAGSRAARGTWSQPISRGASFSTEAARRTM